MIKHVILADDDEDDCVIFSHAVHALDDQVKITCINDCRHLLKYLDANGYPDVIFLDLNMPGMHGLECLQRMAADNMLDTAPVVVYSTSTNPTHIKEALDSGASSYIVKSDSLVTLKQKLRDVFLRY
jgi:CheY-like chemotaxis protein